MIIGVDGNEANVRNRVGVGVYSFNLLKYFQKQAKRELSFIIFLKHPPSPELPKKTKYFRYQVIKGSFLWSQIFLPLRLYLKKDVDVFFSPAHYLPRFCPVPQVVTIHDLAYLYFENDFLKKDLYQLKNWTRYSVNKAKKIIAVSKTTKKDLMKSYAIPEERIEVVYNGGISCHPERRAKRGVEGSLQKKLKIKNFLLFVGTLQPRKNLVVLIDAFYKFSQTNKDFKLVIVGKKGWLYETIFQKVKEMKLEKKVIFTDYISDREIAWFYQNAFCLVMPSLYEGFGIPILEAMSYGCPVVSSFTSSLPEVGGNACLYFDPKSPEELIEKLQTLKDNIKLRNQLIKKGKERVKQFSWEKCAEQTLEVIKKQYASSAI